MESGGLRLERGETSMLGCRAVSRSGNEVTRRSREVAGTDPYKFSSCVVN